jgi:hypothetical protein
MIILSNIWDFLNTYFEDEPLINTISNVKYDKIGSFKETTYPLANIELLIIPTDIETNTLTFTFGITAVSERDFDKTVKNTKLIGKDNKIDNLNAMHYVLQKFITKVSRSNNPYNINIDSTTEMEPILDDFGSGLDGFTFDVTISVPNTIPIC